MTERKQKALNRVQKQQQVMFLSDTATAKGDKVDATYLTNWKDSHEGSVGKNRSRMTFGKEIPTKEDWRLWQRELSKMYTPTLWLLSPLDQWMNPTARIWRYFFDERKDEIQVAADRGV